MRKDNAALLALLSSQRQRASAGGNAELDWHKVVEPATAHRLGPLLFEKLRSARGLNVSAWAMRELKQQYYANFASCAHQYARVQPVLRECCRLGIEVVVLKGAALAELVYPSVECRPFCDIDLLTRRADVGRVFAVLAEHGYELVTGIYGIAEAQLEERGWQATFVRNDSVLELHWHVTDPAGPFHVAVEDLWTRLQPFEIMRTPAQALSPENLLIHACVHLYKHNWRDLLQVYDIYAILECYRESLVWGHIIDACRRYETQQVVLMGLRLSGELFGTQVPDGVSAKLDVKGARAFLASAWPVVVADQIVGGRVPETMTRRLALLHNETHFLQDCLLNQSTVEAQSCGNSWLRRMTYLAKTYGGLAPRLALALLCQVVRQACVSGAAKRCARRRRSEVGGRLSAVPRIKEREEG